MPAFFINIIKKAKIAIFGSKMSFFRLCEKSVLTIFKSLFFKVYENGLDKSLPSV
jgi:hypothetical protein